MMITIPSHLSDDDLVAGVKTLARGEREATAHLIAHLAEFDSRRLYLGGGFSSLFTYCCEMLHLSEPAAYNRIEVARTARTFPAILPMLGEGLLSLATARLLASHLTAENQQELLSAAANKSKRAVEEMLVGRFPRPEVPSSVRKLPTHEPLWECSGAMTVAQVAGLPSSLAPPMPPRRPIVRPLAPERFEVRVTVSAEARENLRLAQDLLRHALPHGDPAEIIERALKLLVEQLRRKRYAATDRPRVAPHTVPGSRNVAAKVRRAVALRDGGRCTFVGKGGRRCNERAFVEFHHDEPYGVGGEGTVENIQLLCRAHNAYESERFYGRWHPIESPTLPGKSVPPTAAHFTRAPPPPRVVVPGR